MAKQPSLCLNWSVTPNRFSRVAAQIILPICFPVPTLFVCNEALLSSLLMSGDIGEVLGVGQGVPILPGEPGLPGLLGRSGEFTGLVRRGLDRNVIFIGLPNVFLP